MSISETVLGQLPGEDAQTHEARCKEFRAACSETFSTPSGRKVLAALSIAAPPFEPRFSGDYNPIQAAFEDGKKDVTGFLILNSGQK